MSIAEEEIRGRSGWVESHQKESREKKKRKENEKRGEKKNSTR